MKKLTIKAALKNVETAMGAYKAPTKEIEDLMKESLNLVAEAAWKYEDLL